MGNILVSVCCITYNHEKYITEAIESFLMQKTNFKYEILIHDDASTDKTPDIIRYYAAKFPEIIQPIFQTENQHSKQKRISACFVWPKARGKYIALCEGDDFWTNSSKLQTQVDYLESHPECSLATHAATYVKENGKSNGENLLRPAQKDSVLSAEEIISKEGLIPTASMMFPVHIVKNLPSWYYNAPVGDYPLALICAHKGVVNYQNKAMSAYRRFVPGSWTETVLKNKIKLRKHWFGMMQTLKMFDEYSSGKYSPVIKKKIKNHEQFLFWEKEKPSFSYISENKEIFRQLSFRDKFIFYLRICFPSIYKLGSKIKRLLKAH